MKTTIVFIGLFLGLCTTPIVDVSSGQPLVTHKDFKQDQIDVKPGSNVT